MLLVVALGEDECHRTVPPADSVSLLLTQWHAFPSLRKENGPAGIVHSWGEKRDAKGPKAQSGNPVYQPLWKWWSRQYEHQKLHYLLFCVKMLLLYQSGLSHKLFLTTSVPTVVLCLPAVWVLWDSKSQGANWSTTGDKQCTNCEMSQSSRGAKTTWSMHSRVFTAIHYCFNTYQGLKCFLPTVKLCDLAPVQKCPVMGESLVGKQQREQQQGISGELFLLHMLDY